MLILIDNEDIRVTAILNECEDVTLCFTGIGHRTDELEVQTEEFFSLSKRSTVFFITDKKRTWGNRVDFALLCSLLETYIKGRPINTIGNSMGGFLAILATCFFEIRVALAFVPQFSVSKKIIPDETRFDQYVEKISNWKYESLKDCFNDKTHYYILAGTSSEIEAQQINLFPSKKNIEKLFFLNPEFDHKVAQKLKEFGILHQVIAECFRGGSAYEIKHKCIRNQEIICCIQNEPP
jgi:hypothetical protein